MLIEEAQRDFARRTRYGMCSVAAHLVVWLALCIAGMLLPNPNYAAAAYIVGLLFLWPLSWIFSKLLRTELTPDNPFSKMVWTVGGLYVLFLPLLMGAYFSAPSMVPWTLSVLSSTVFVLYFSIYGSPAYLFGALGLIEVATLIGWLAPGVAFLGTALGACAILLITAVFIGGEISSRKKMLRRM